MNKEKPGSAKLLFVLSNDFGEFATAMYFVRGYGFETVFVMPDLLYSVHGNSIPYPVYRYKSVRDITSLIEQENPDIVFLFSGYLYAINNIFSVETVGSLVQDLQNRRRRIVTSDPFLGLMSGIDGSTFSNNHPLRQWLADHFSRVSRIFKNVTHLYLVNTESLTSRKSVSFFNANMIAGRDGLADYTRRLSQSIDVEPTAKRWLFVLSTEDYAAQVNRHGKNEFNDLLFKRLQDSALQGRQPVLVGPQMAIDPIRLRRPAIDGLVTVPFARHDLFLSLLLDAEYAFYWNTLSNSILFRAMNDLPVFFLDPGHLLHAIQPLFKRAMSLYYADAEMPYLNGGDELSAGKLTVLASQQGRAFARAMSEFSRLPDPQRIVNEILAGTNE